MLRRRGIDPAHKAVTIPKLDPETIAQSRFGLNVCLSVVDCADPVRAHDAARAVKAVNSILSHATAPTERRLDAGD